MFFYLSKVLWFFAAPGNALLFALVAGLIMLSTRFRRLGKALVGLCMSIAVLLTFLPVGDWMTHALEYRFPMPKTVPEQVDGIVVLGGVINPKMTSDLGTPVIGGAVERIFVSAELARRYPDAKIIYSGGSGSLTDTEAREADYVSELYASLGVPLDRLILDREARNTWENAKIAFALADPAPDETWILLTSAFHMPRAVGVFRSVGWEMLPYPVDYMTHPSDAFDAPMDFASGLGRFSTAFHEWLGLSAYWLTGKTDAAFPKPRSMEVR